MKKLLYRNIIRIIEDTVGLDNSKLQDEDIRSQLAEQLYLEVIDYNCEPDAYGSQEEDAEEEWTGDGQYRTKEESVSHLMQSMGYEGPE
mgnify:CR=1 FL=1